jgi:hypothetical protein
MPHTDRAAGATAFRGCSSGVREPPSAIRPTPAVIPSRPSVMQGDPSGLDVIPSAAQRCAAQSVRKPILGYRVLWTP